MELAQGHAHSCNPCISDQRPCQPAALLTRRPDQPATRSDLGEQIRSIGHEYGTTTGRPRRVGWLDMVALRYVSGWLTGCRRLLLLGCCWPAGWLLCRACKALSVGACTCCAGCPSCCIAATLMHGCLCCSLGRCRCRRSTASRTSTSQSSTCWTAWTRSRWAAGWRCWVQQWRSAGQGALAHAG